ncbi:unnamed protein product, partial [Pelagomonas calceolata]
QKKLNHHLHPPPPSPSRSHANQTPTPPSRRARSRQRPAPARASRGCPGARPRRRSPRSSPAWLGLRPLQTAPRAAPAAPTPPSRRARPRRRPRRRRTGAAGVPPTSSRWRRRPAWRSSKTSQYASGRRSHTAGSPSISTDTLGPAHSPSQAPLVTSAFSELLASPSRACCASNLAVAHAPHVRTTSRSGASARLCRTSAQSQQLVLVKRIASMAYSGALLCSLATRAHECDARRSDGLCGLVEIGTAPRRRARA